MKLIRAFIVDDEPLAIQEMKWMLRDFSDVMVIGHSSTANDAIDQINTIKPDLIFLDINIPEKNGFDIVNELSFFPQIIFVTAYDEYALKAFEINAIDYLMKPLGQERLVKALAKVRVSDKGGLSKVFVKDGDIMRFIETSTIIWMESVGNYIKIYHDGGSNMIYKSLNAMEEQLRSEHFFRANRKQLFNLHRMDSAHRLETGWMVRLTDGTEIQLSQRQGAKFFSLNKKVDL